VPQSQHGGSIILTVENLEAGSQSNKNRKRSLHRNQSIQTYEKQRWQKKKDAKESSDLCDKIMIKNMGNMQSANHNHFQINPVAADIKDL
jgi:hypothetical protein